MKHYSFNICRWRIKTSLFYTGNIFYFILYYISIMLSYLCTGSEDFCANPDTDYQTKNGKDEFYSEVDQAL